MGARVVLLALVGLVTLGLATLPVRAAPEQQRTVIRVGSAAKVVSQWPFIMAMARGTFERMNLDVDFVTTRTEPLSMQYLVSNSIDIAIASPGSAFTATEAGGNVAIVGGLQNRMTYTLVVRPEIRTLQDLRGKEIGTDQVRGTVPAIAKELIRPSGLEPDRDYDLRVVGGINERYAAMVANVVAGTVLAPPWDTRARTEGYPILANTLTDLPPMQWNGYTVQRGWASSNRDAVARFLAALRISGEWLYDPANREEAIRLLASELGAEEALIRENYATMVATNQVFSRDGGFDRDGVERLIGLFAREGLIATPLPLDRYIDLSFWEASLRY